MITEPTTNSVVITGASTGIGRACALYLDEQGYCVFAGVRKKADAEALHQQASKRLTPVFIDVTQPQSIQTAVQTVIDRIGLTGLMGLINNAGIAIGGPLEFVPLDDLRKQLEVNVIGQVAITQTFLPLIRQRKGRIINISSISGRVAMPFVGPYTASKFSLEALTDSLRLELKPWGIEVVSIQPGAIATPIWGKTDVMAGAMMDKFPPEADNLYGTILNRLRKQLQQTGEHGILPEEVAKVVFKALTAKRPKTRYLVGRDAKLGALAVKFLPDRLRDWFIMRM